MMRSFHYAAYAALLGSGRPARRRRGARSAAARSRGSSTGIAGSRRSSCARYLQAADGASLPARVARRPRHPARRLPAGEGGLRAALRGRQPPGVGADPAPGRAAAPRGGGVRARPHRRGRRAGRARARVRRAGRLHRRRRARRARRRRRRSRPRCGRSARRSTGPAARPAPWQRCAAPRPSRLVEPVIVAWPGRETRALVRAARRVRRAASWRAAASTASPSPRTASALLPGALPVGYHRLHVEAGGRQRGGARDRAAGPRARRRADRGWGVFLPLYALPVRRAGGGPRRPARAACGRPARRGIGARRHDAALRLVPRPTPSSRAPTRRPAACSGTTCSSTSTRCPSSSARPRPARRSRPCPGRPPTGWSTTAAPPPRGASVLQALADAAYGDDGAPRGAGGVRRRDPAACADYAAFRAGAEPDAARGPPPTRLRAVGRRAAARRGGRAPRTRPAPASTSTCPLGVHRAAYDVARRAGVVRRGHPRRRAARRAGPATARTGSCRRCTPSASRETGHRYTIACLRTAFRHARALRIDHVAGLPPPVLGPGGLRRRRGALRALPGRGAVRHRARRGAPPRRRGGRRGPRHRAARPCATRSSELGILRSYVLQFELDADDDGPAPDPAAAQPREPRHPRHARRSPPGGATGGDAAGGSGGGRRGGSPELGAGPARFVLAEPGGPLGRDRPQNVPGTTGGANWRRCARHDVAALERLPVVAATFRALKEARP